MITEYIVAFVFAMGNAQGLPYQFAEGPFLVQAPCEAKAKVYNLGLDKSMGQYECLSKTRPTWERVR